MGGQAVVGVSLTDAALTKQRMVQCPRVDYLHCLNLRVVCRDFIFKVMLAWLGIKFDRFGVLT